VLSFPFGSALASVEAEPVCGSVRDPSADGGALCCGGLVDGVGKVGRQRDRSLLSLSHEAMVGRAVGQRAPRVRNFQRGRIRASRLGSLKESMAVMRPCCTTKAITETGVLSTVTTTPGAPSTRAA
jgi:hypothetical protein